MRSRKAFSIIEVIFVLVVLGIVASITSQIIAQVYENYIQQRAVYNISTRTELVVNQIVNRLSYRIQGSTISKDHETFLAGGFTASRGVNWLPLKDVPTTGETYTSIEWIGYDNDSLAAYTKQPGWSGVANYESASKNRFDTPGSYLVHARDIISHLSIDENDMTHVDLQNRPAAVLFDEKDNYYDGNREYDPICMGLIPEDAKSNTDCIFPVLMDDNNTLRFTRASDPNSAAIRDKIITERYKLAWSAYAVAPEPRQDAQGNIVIGTDGRTLYDLVLYSNYQPWNGDTYLSGTRHVLMSNVSVFKFSETGGVIRFKICAQEDIGQRESDGTPINVSICKEKAVIR
ncbi:MAG: prepilin-type N-terminal cleavage/methylation domain-containing protein [Campylobacterales bacterium]|nr:prepilin-type N-terminal cleavage/methylation domain-containing protein [Campylobacterales bacterium]